MLYQYLSLSKSSIRKSRYKNISIPVSIAINESIYIWWDYYLIHIRVLFALRELVSLQHAHDYGVWLLHEPLRLYSKALICSIVESYRIVMIWVVYPTRLQNQADSNYFPSLASIASSRAYRKCQLFYLLIISISDIYLVRLKASSL